MIAISRSRVLRRAVELGVDLIDTADSYGPNVAEELIRDALHPYPATLKIATKAGLTRSGPNQWAPNGRPEYLRAQCEGSLRRLGVDQIDLFQLHRVDPEVPADEQFGLLRALRDEGKVREVGLSEVGVDQVEAAQRIVPIVSVQNQYNLGHRGGEDVVDYAEQHDIGFIPWFPLASGNLSAARRAARRGGAGARRHRLPGLPGLAPPPFPCHGPDTRDVVGRAPRGELRRRRHHVDRHPVRRAVRRPQIDAALGVGSLNGREK